MIHGRNKKIIFKKECYVIQGAIFDVYREMGAGFLESVYQECLEIEMSKRKIPFISQHSLKLSYKGEELCQIYKPDFICFGKIIVELKTVKRITAGHEAQILNFLKATGIKLGLLINFWGYPKVDIKRFVL
ncbi:MAG: GxxExxY protein [Gammaproteobacteria bacterium]|nr:GxxExxY protein [Gammaproteobacteria bacterium]